MSVFQSNFLPVYITPAQVRRVLGTLSQSTNDDDILLSFCDEVSRRIERECNRYFFPRRQLIKCDWSGESFTLDLPDDMLSLVTLTNGNGQVIPTSTTVGGTTVQVIYQYPSHEHPKSKIQLGINSSYVFLFIGTPQQAISIDALWGYPYYENTGQWNALSSATVQNAVSQNATTTQLLVPTGSFQVGQTLYIEDEFEIVQAVTTGATTDTLTVARGACGSTAATHLNGTAIYIVLVHPEIFRAASRYVSYCYRKKDSGVDGDSIGITGFGQYVTPLEMPADVRGILRNLRRGHWGSR